MTYTFIERGYAITEIQDKNYTKSYIYQNHKKTFMYCADHNYMYVHKKCNSYIGCGPSVEVIVEVAFKQNR